MTRPMLSYLYFVTSSAIGLDSAPWLPPAAARGAARSPGRTARLHSARPLDRRPNHHALRGGRLERVASERLPSHDHRTAPEPREPERERFGARRRFGGASAAASDAAGEARGEQRERDHRCDQLPADTG